MTFRDWFFQQFPDYFQVSDSYKDANQEGLLQRYLRIFGLELDQNIMPFIDNFTDIIDPQIADPKFLPLIAGLIGSPPSLNADADLYRKVLAYALSIYKVKGTKKSYELYLAMIGVTVELDEEEPGDRIYYDRPNTFYDDDPQRTYDSECEFCTGYTIIYNYSNSPYTQDEIEDMINAVVPFIQPINAKLLGLEGVS